MAQQTAVNWLIEQIESGKIEIVYSNKIHSIKCIPEIKEQAKEMEKQQIEDAYNKGTINGIDYPESKLALTGDQYYTQTYGK